ncbi:VanZ family protein [Gracilibacillus kekensis]|uniref:VanZ like family protein n=1 Tax=Gracilibacillus kekensis TaxID=1027249 RepID=A0A1M7QAF1_9BACI|nr:VanZ family protein [Gracilibacillus kekensis]SHN27575.1 VanZ like family protein [Gracilibacillus kekensis]
MSQQLKYKIYRIVLWLIFICYLLISSFLLIFERIIVRISDYFNGIEGNRYHTTISEDTSLVESFWYNANLVPFNNTYHYLTGSDYFSLVVIFNNIIGNILVFLPLGLLLPLLFQTYRKFSKLLVTVTVLTVLVEVMQISLRIGQFDVDDIILNVVGGVIGYLFFRVMLIVHAKLQM